MIYDNSLHTVNVITADSVELARHYLPTDQGAELEPGCRTWAFQHDAGRGQITVWPNGRGAIEFGADSEWGDWDEDEEVLVTDDAVYSFTGELIEPDAE